MRKGFVPAAGASSEIVRRGMQGKMGDANLVPGGLSTGKTANGEPVGSTDAVTVEIPLVGGKTEYTISHGLRRVPGFVKLVGVRNPVSALTCVAIAWIGRDQWTDTSATIYVHLLNGSFDNAILTLEVGGGR